MVRHLVCVLLNWQTHEGEGGKKKENHQRFLNDILHFRNLVLGVTSAVQMSPSPKLPTAPLKPSDKSLPNTAFNRAVTADRQGEIEPEITS